MGEAASEVPQVIEPVIYVIKREKDKKKINSNIYNRSQTVYQPS